jgi:hypothetical protein
MKIIKRGVKFRIAPYGVCVVVGYDGANKQYIMRVWNSDKTFYISKEKLEKGVNRYESQ